MTIDEIEIRLKRIVTLYIVTLYMVAVVIYVHYTADQHVLVEVKKKLKKITKFYSVSNTHNSHY